MATTLVACVWSTWTGCSMDALMMALSSTSTCSSVTKHSKCESPGESRLARAGFRQLWLGAPTRPPGPRAPVCLAITAASWHVVGRSSVRAS